MRIRTIVRIMTALAYMAVLLALELPAFGADPAPDISVSPPSLSESLFTGGSVTRTLRIANTGGSDLSFQVGIVNASAMRAAGTPGLLPAGARSDVAPETPMARSFVMSLMVGADVLLLQDVAPWGTGSNEQILAANGIAFDSVDSGSLAGTDLSRYRLLVVASDQPMGFYSTLATQLSRIEAWVAAGGVLEFHAASGGWETGDTSILTLPRGMRMFRRFAEFNYVLDSAHPLVAGVPSPFFGSSASHTSFTDIPVDASLVASDDAGQPNLVTYRDGLGLVVAGGQTFEFALATGQAAGQILVNMIPYAHEQRPRWLTVDSSGGVVPAGGTVDLSVTFDAAGLNGGDYDAQIVVSSNDPDETEVTVPAHLHVTGVADIEVTPAALDYGPVFIGTSSTRTISVANAGTDVLTVTSVTSDHGDFSADASSFTLGVGETRDITVTYGPSSPGPVGATLSIESDDPDEPVATVSLSGEGLIPPDVSVSPPSLSESLFTGGSVTRTLRIANTGGSDLSFSIGLVPADSAARASVGAASLPVLKLEKVQPPGPPTTLGRYDAGRTPARAPFTSVSAPGAAGNLAVLILHSGSDINEIRTLLQSFPDFSVVDVFDARDQVPSLAQLTPYRAVIVSSNYPFSSPDGVGNVLADYVDGGGGVVLTVPSYVQQWSVAGRFASGGYLPLVGAEGPLGSSTLGPFDATHPIMRGVISAWGDLLASGTLAEDAELVASWNGGLPFVATKGPHVAAINVFVGAPGYWTGDIPLILHNAAFWSTGIRWLSVGADSGVVPAGTYQDILVTFDATGLNGGEYDAQIVVSSNDPDETEVTVPAHLHVTGVADIEVTPAALDYGSVFIGTSSTRTISVANAGTDVLTVTSVTSDHGDFSADDSSFTLGVGETRDITITYGPSSPGPVGATLSIESDDPDEPVATVSLSGEGLIPPDVSVSPTSLSESLFTGGSVTRTLRIANTGGSDLSFDLTIRGTTLAPAPGPPPPSASSPRGRRGDAGLPPPKTGASRDGWKGVLVAPSAPVAPSAGTYSGAFLAFGITDYGEVMPYQYPIGNEDLAVGGWFSGYTVAYVSGGFDHVCYALTNDRLGITPMSYREIRNTPEIAEIEVVTRTSDGILEITQRIVFSKATRYFTVTAEITNLLDAPVSNVVFKRSADWDVDADYEDDSWDYDTARNMVLAWDQTYVAMAGVETPLFMDIDGWNDFEVRGTLVDIPVGPVSNFDGNEVLHFDLGTVGAGESKTIHAVYGAGTSLSELQQAIDRGRALATWLSYDRSTGTVPAGGYQDILVTFDATGLNGGEYDAQIVVSSNDPDETEVTVPAHLHVTGVADIEVTPAALDYGPVFIGTSSTRTISVANAGTDVLTVTSVTSDHGDFSADASSFTLGVGETRDITVTYGPSSPGPVGATLRIESDDPDEPVATVSLSGEGLIPPDVSVSPPSLSESLFTGGSVTRTLRIANTGGSDLSFQVGIVNASAMRAAGTPGLLPAGARSDVAPETPMARSFVTSLLMVGADVLLLQDVAPWGTGSNEQILAANGIAFDMIGSGSLAGADLSHYRLLIVASDQPMSFYITLATQLSRIEAWVAAGGVLEFHAASGGYQSGDTSILTLPRGMRMFRRFAGFNYVLDSAHPLVAGVPSPFFGSNASHTSFTDIPVDASLVASDDAGQPNLVTYRDGLGLVVAGGQTFEFALATGQAAGQILVNMIPYAHEQRPRWLTVDSSGGVVPAGGTVDLSVTFDAAGLNGGDYDAQIVVSSNDPDHPSIPVHAHLHVRCTGTPSQCAPVAVCNDVTVEADAHCAGHVTAEQIDAGSYDPNGQPLTRSLDPAGPFGLGATTVTLTVTNSDGASSTCQSIVNVIDLTPPALSVRLNPDTLWQPNHAMVPVDAVAVATDNCGSVSIVLTSVVSSEADNGTDDGDTINDIAQVEPGTADFHFALRAERAGNGPGRIYTAFYEARDSAGNRRVADAHTVVPHDHGMVDSLYILLDHTAAGTRVSWTPTPPALSYDVVRGRLAAIRETSVVVDLGPVTCIARNAQGSSTPGRDPEMPAPGEIFFYLVEYDDGTSTSYGRGTTKPRAPGPGTCD